jgi:23S rRNA (uracil1939-C5)-methyltransferase
LDVVIERLVHRGAGLARIDGRVCLVPGTAPGDRVRVRTVRERPGLIEAVAVEILEPGPDRVAPRCPVYGRCGGCQWQHLDATRQPSLKAGILVDTVRRLGRIDLPTPRIVAGAPWAWRGRIELHASPRAALGFFAAGSHEIVPCEGCPIALPALSDLIGPLRHAVAAHPPDGPITIEPVAGADGSIVVVVRGSGRGPTVLANAIAALPGVSGVTAGTVGRGGTRWAATGQTHVPWTVPGPDGPLTLHLDPRGFSQANPGLNPDLVRTVATALDARAGTRVLELYAGAGNLTVPLAAGGLDLTAVEVNAPAMAEGRAAVEALGRTGRFLPGRVEDVVHSLAGSRFDAVVADPPRTGLGPVARAVADLAASRLVLVSCEPATLARDLRVLADAGYGVQDAILIDMFPQTWHIEAVVLLERGDG